MSEIGTLIYNRRKELDLTLEEVGNAVGVSKSTVKKWENGHISNMRRDKIEKLASVLQISPVRLLNVKERRTTTYDDKHLEAEKALIMEAYHDYLKKNAPKVEDSIWEKMLNFFNADITEETKSAPVKDENFTRISVAYDKLNDIGKRKAVERIEELAEIDRYKK